MMRISRMYLDEATAVRLRVKVWPAGTVVFPKQGGAIATNKKRMLAQPGACDLNTMGVVPGDRLTPEFLLLCLEAVDLPALSDGSVVAQIKPSRVAELVISVPPLDEQRHIVARVGEQLSVIDALLVAIHRAQRRSASLRGAVLERAFRGELVCCSTGTRSPTTTSSEHSSAGGSSTCWSTNTKT